MSMPVERVCEICGASMPKDLELCPHCAFQEALRVSQPATELLAGENTELQFGHYKVQTDENGTPHELGRGAMGITYKAFDVDLQRSAALKVISPRYLSDESARLRFVREARAAASVRHPNVASVFHLGTSNETYFYAMEFVEGETLGNLIKRSGRLDAKLAIEIVRQVAAGLDAVHKANLVHRDIKPSNIMVNLGPGEMPMVKIIDLGLAKTLSESESQVAISLPGAFVGTPEFASPEQFSGGEVDIRSDLYSLGVTLWQMLAGQPPFRGSLNDVIYLHRQAPPPLEKLKGVLEPAVALLQVLLRKEPARRFQDPAELLAAMPMVRDALDSGHRLFQTIRVSISSASDVQKEKNLAERVLRAIAAELSLPVSDLNLRCQRLAEADVVSADSPQNTDFELAEPFVLCPYFWEGEAENLLAAGQIPNPAEFDLVVSIVWSRLGTQVGPPLPDGAAPVSTTEYEIAWALHHAASGHGIPQLRVYRSSAKPVPPLEPKEAREEFGRQWDAVEEFFANLAQKSETNSNGTFNTYRSLEEFEDLFREHFRAFLGGQFERDLRKPGTKMHRWKSSPFRGLNAFDFEHAPIFYGRTRAIGEVFEALEEQRRAQRPFVLVLGASGSGKSSLVRAGVLPLLVQPGTIEGIGLWRRAVTRPAAGGSDGDCFDALAAALLDPMALPDLANPESADPIRDLAAELRDHADAVALRVRDALDHAAREWKTKRTLELRRTNQNRKCTRIGANEESGGSVDSVGHRQQGESDLPRARLALVIDQLEELFTSNFSRDIRQRYVSAVAGLAQSGRVFVLAALRGDFYSSYQEFPELIELTRPSGKIDLRPPTAYEIGNMIRLPAEAAGLRFERDHATEQRLDEALRDAASTTPESLPLLEHVLSLLYEKQAERGDDLLRWSDYRELGELKGALAKYAQTVFSTLQPSEQLAFPLVMRHLVTLGQGEEEVPNRRTVPYRDFIAETGPGETGKSGAKGFVDLFIEKRLLVADTDPQGEVTVSVAHEALLREWQPIREWLAENREFLRMRDRLDSSLKLWLSRGQQKDDLLGPGLPLAEGEKLLSGFASSLSHEQSDYIRSSIAEQKRRQRIRERIRYGVTAAITAALIVAIIFGVVSYRQYRRAERAKLAADRAAKRATLARNDAGKLINYMTIDLRDKLRPIGRLDLLDDVNRRVLEYYTSVRSASPEVLSQWSVALANSGDIQKDRGDLTGALKSYTGSLSVREKLAKLNPGNGDWQRYLALGIANVGDVLNLQGDSSGALQRYETALKILQGLVTRQPGSADLRHDLSLIEESIGQVLEKRGDLTRALETYQNCLAIRQELKKQEPGNVERDHDISLVLLKIGWAFSRQGSLADAVKSYRESLEIQQRLVDGQPTNAVWQQELASSENGLASGLSEQGDLAGALAMYRESVEILRKLTERDPSNANWQRLLARSYSDQAFVYVSQGNLTAALENCQQALEIRDVLAKRDPSNAIAQRELAVGYDDLGKVLELEGDEAGAKEKYNVSLSISRRVAAQDPSNAEWQRDLAISLERVGAVLSAGNDVAGASEKYAEMLSIRKKLALRDESNAQWQNDLSWGYISVGDLYAAKGDMNEALANYRIAQAIERRLVQRDSKTLEVQSDLAVTCQKVGDILRSQGHIPEALDSYRECVALGENLVNKDPTNDEWSSNLAFAYYLAATTGSKIGQKSDAENRALLEKARGILVKLQGQSALSPVDLRHLQDIQIALGGS